MTKKLCPNKLSSDNLNFSAIRPFNARDENKTATYGVFQLEDIQQVCPDLESIPKRIIRQIEKYGIDEPLFLAQIIRNNESLGFILYDSYEMELLTEVTASSTSDIALFHRFKTALDGND